MVRAKKKEKPTPRVYVGPTLPGGVLSYGTVFCGEGYPAHVAAVIEDRPAVRGLIVPVTQLAEATKAVKTKGHILNTYARQARLGG